MILGNKSLLLILFADSLILIICIFGFIQIREKSALPISFNRIEDHLEVDSILTKNFKGYKLQFINNIPVRSLEELECVLDGVPISKRVELGFKTSTGLIFENMTTIQFYSVRYIIIASFVCLVFFVIGVFVLLKRSKEITAKLLHAGSLSTAIIIATTWGNYNIEPTGIGYLVRIAFSAGYSFAPMFFIDFVFSLRDRKRKSYKIVRPFLYTISSALFLLQSMAFLRFINDQSIDSIRNYLDVFSLFRIYLMIYLIIGLVVFIYTYKTTTEEYEKKKLRWIVFGFISGVLSLIVLWILPYLIFGQGLVPEEVILILILSIPITFGISIVRYRLFNIDLLIERSLVYGLGLLLLLSTYSLVIIIITAKLNFDDSTIPAIITAALVAIFFQPVNTRMKTFVNKKFFKIQYNFREEIKSFLNDIKQINDIASLAKITVERTDKLIPNQKIGFFLLLTPENRLSLSAHKGFSFLEGRSVRFDEHNLMTTLLIPVGVYECIESGAEFEIADSRVFKRWGIMVAFPIKSEMGKIFGFLVLGEKKSRTKFTIEDLDLLTTISTSVASIIDRIKLQEDLIREHLESERLKELNELKSLFVSTVSHDLKTPITSIRMFAELLKSNKEIDREKSNNYLSIIEGESDRLTRLINNVLDYAKIEKGIKEYNFEFVDLNEIVNEVMLLLDYQIRMKNFIITANITNSKNKILGDRDAISGAIINLLSNSLKYSDKKKEVEVITEVDNNYYKIIIKDYGIGIDKSEVDKILIPYFRSEDKTKNKKVGTGLGLAIIKHTMNAHKGKINIESKLGEGSKFTLLFPKGGNDE